MSLNVKSRTRDNTVTTCKVDIHREDGSYYGPVYFPEDVTLKGIQITESEGHARGRDGRYHEGGPFLTSRTESRIGTASLGTEVPINGGILVLHGDVLCPWPDPFEPGGHIQFAERDFGNLDELGATAVAQVSPTNSASSLATALGEIKKDGLPSLPGIHTWQDRTNLAKSAGAEFLNAEFGWLPLISDILHVGNAARHSRDIVTQYQKDEGTDVHREFSFPIEDSTNDIQLAVDSQYPLGIHGDHRLHGPVGANLYRKESNTVRRWFSGSFTYALPSRTDSFRRMLGYGSEADKLFGITITPDVLWELAPWSWAVDWFSNAGDVIHNATSFGLAGLVMRYGYMMEETSSKIIHTMDSCAIKNAEGLGIGPSVTEAVTKIRRPADPFGFGFTGVDLSPTQIAIAAALGLTRWL